ncbi:lipase member H-A-like [Condylostylus longicornis]|uniref:lipase member H-A-like n=1 Tax=Condylostylus longicornis TaxID=2530218 RepID=UPI00244DB8D9|nr:lipase member H-A-like [Condylostylus longicornis]
MIASFTTTNGQYVNLTAIKFVYYYGPETSDNETYSIEENWKILNHPFFNNSKRTTCYIHGYTESQSAESVQTIIKAYLTQINEFNLITLDWKKLASGRYISDAVKNALILGDLLGEVFIRFFKNGMNLEKFHFIGHSLGAQLAGLIGRSIQRNSDGEIKIPRITGLDPAFPGFYIFPLRKALNADDGDFVDIIHTDGLIYGAPLSIGTVDFWPNRGSFTQPSCPKRNFKILSENDVCSHHQAWKFWAESVTNLYNVEFFAAKALSWQDFRIRSQFMKLPLAKMGINCPKNISGKYYLQTNPKSPFARGLDGAIYNNKLQNKIKKLN